VPVGADDDAVDAAHLGPEQLDLDCVASASTAFQISSMTPVIKDRVRPWRWLLSRPSEYRTR